MTRKLAAVDARGSRPFQRAAPFHGDTHMGVLVLATPSDATAVRVALLLRQRNRAERVLLCTEEEIVLAHWEHRISSGGIDTTIRLHDGSSLACSKRTVIFNRLSTIGTPISASASRVDH